MTTKEIRDRVLLAAGPRAREAVVGPFFQELRGLVGELWQKVYPWHYTHEVAVRGAVWEFMEVRQHRD